MKRKVFLALICALLFGAFTVYAAEPLYGLYNGYTKVKVTVNDKEVKFSNLDTPGFIIDGKTVLPVRELAESLKSYLHWDESTSTVELVRPNVNMMVASSVSLSKDGKSYYISAPFGVVNEGSSYSFDIFAQVDTLPMGTSYFKMVIEDPKGSVVKSFPEETFTSDSKADSFSYSRQAKSFSFDLTGIYKVKFYFKADKNGEYASIAEKAIYAK